MNELTACFGLFAFLLALMVLALSQPMFSRTKSEVTVWFGMISFLLGWMVFFLGTPIRKTMREPVSDYFRMFALFTGISCWLVGLFCGLAARQHLRGKLAILLNFVILALLLIFSVTSVIFPPTRSF